MELTGPLELTDYACLRTTVATSHGVLAPVPNEALGVDPSVTVWSSTANSMSESPTRRPGGEARPGGDGVPKPESAIETERGSPSAVAAAVGPEDTKWPRPVVPVALAAGRPRPRRPPTRARCTRAPSPRCQRPRTRSPSQRASSRRRAVMGADHMESSVLSEAAEVEQLGVGVAGRVRDGLGRAGRAAPDSDHDHQPISSSHVRARRERDRCGVSLVPLTA